MRRPTSIETEILRRSYENPTGKLNLYDLHRDNLLSPGQLSNACRPLEEAGVITVEDVPEIGPTVTLTPEGRQWVIHYRKQLFMRNDERPWAYPVKSAQGRSIALNEPYLPNLRRLKKQFFLSGIEAPPKHS